MLVLSRKRDEQIVINDEITITVVEIRGDKVRLGVQAPKEIPVHRKEVYDAIRRVGSTAEIKVGEGGVEGATRMDAEGQSGGNQASQDGHESAAGT